MLTAGARHQAFMKDYAYGWDQCYELSHGPLREPWGVPHENADTYAYFALGMWVLSGILPSSSSSYRVTNGKL